MTLHPAEPDSGIVFRRTDVAGRGARVPAVLPCVSDSTLCTTLCNGEGAKVSTVEHLMAALSGCDIDNVMIDLDGPEVPIMDGSAAPFVFLIECSGIAEQQAPRKAIRILKPVEVREGERMASLTPADGFSISFEIDFPSPAVARQSCSFAISNGSFKTHLCRARTFGFVHELEQLRAWGLARGGSLQNAIVVSGDRVLNEGGLRYDNEFVRHKTLDSMGDLYLLGAPLIGHFRGLRSGHALNHRLLRELLDNEDAWCLTAMPAESAVPTDALGQSLAASA